jgi:hypothetical protein
VNTPALLADCVWPVVRDLARRSGKDLSRWIEQVHRLGGCAEPVRLAGESMTLDATTGHVLSSYSTASEPHGQLLIRCGNRRASRCPSCAELYRRDTFHLIRAGLLGEEKGVPATVHAHPRAFLTLTAPSFGPVHLGPDKDGVRTLASAARLTRTRTGATRGAALVASAARRSWPHVRSRTFETRSGPRSGSPSRKRSPLRTWLAQ